MTVSYLPLEVQYKDVMKVLEDMETQERIQHHPHLLQRAPPLELHEYMQETPTGDSSETTPNDGDRITGIVTSMVSESLVLVDRRNLRIFTISPIPPTLNPLTLTRLSVSHNELMDLPGLSLLQNLQELNIERNWFNTLPGDIGKLSKLTTLNASRNFLKPSETSLRLQDLKQLQQFKMLNLLYNQKCGRDHHRSYLQQELPRVEILMTLWTEVGNVPGTYVGSCAAERTATLLRSQLEPLGTVALRKRLVQDFGQVPTDPAMVGRAGVMERLLECYRREGLADDEGISLRKQVYLDGVPVEKTLIDALLVELKRWTNETGLCNKNRERPSIQADNYMILRSPKFDSQQQPKRDEDMPPSRASRRALRKAKKLERYRRIWDLAHEAMMKVDPAFAERCTEIAVTYKFQGSPHRDKQNCGPFYGFAMGDFSEGEGGICVECSARMVAVMNTKNRLGRVDGRYPHWVAPYDERSDRYSLIYYETGNDFVRPGPAVFSFPSKSPVLI